MISVSSFEYRKRCETAYKLSRLMPEKTERYVVSQMVREVCEHFSYSENEIRQFFENNLLEEWYPLKFLKESQINKDTFMIIRFLDFIKKENLEIISTNSTICYEFEGESIVRTINLVAQKTDGRYIAITAHPKASKKSFKGKTTQTNIRNDIGAAITKFILEKEYPHIEICEIYLLSSKDGEALYPELNESQSKDSNIFRLNYDGFYNENGVLDFERFEKSLKTLLKEKVEKDCSNCIYQRVCNLTPIVESKEETCEEKKKEVFYTERQRAAIEKKGPTLIVAGPGSGKTATIVGKIKYLIESGVDANNILLISFTNEAVREMQERCKEFCKELPNITTVNGLANKIVQNFNMEMYGKTLPILTDSALKEIIKNLLECSEDLMAEMKLNCLTGDYGTLNRLAGMYKKYINSEELIVGEKTYHFIETLASIIKAREFITFDEQILLALDILNNNKEIMKMYQRLFKYVLFDEFQDIDENQWEFVKLLALPQNEITVVGDDDQCIYSFRGSSNKFIREFSEIYGTAPIVLDMNFRSTSAIVNSATHIISNSTDDRIDKDVLSASNEVGNKPLFVKGKERLEEIIEKCKAEGFNYKDIVVLARTNKEIQSINQTLKVPTVIGKSYLTSSSMFSLFEALLKLASKKDDDESLYKALKVLGYEEYLDKANCKLSEIVYSDKKLQNFISYTEQFNFCYTVLFENEDGAFLLLDSFCTMLGIKESNAFYQAMKDVIELYNIRTMEELEEKVFNLDYYQDCTKMQLEDKGDCVKLITFHESKGLEFPCVIILDDEKCNYLEDNEALRVLYVGITRSKKRVILMSNRMLEFIDDFEQI